MPTKPVGNRFLERTAELPLFSGEEAVGRVQPRPERGPWTYYEHPSGTLTCGDALEWLASLEPESVDLAFADPPYNLGKADWDSFESHDAYVEWAVEWIALVARALKPTGSLYVCGFSEILADLRRPGAAHFAACRWLVWHYKNKANLGRDWGRSHESMIHFRKSKHTRINLDDVRVPYGRHTLRYPTRPQSSSSKFSAAERARPTWTPHPRGAKPKDVLEVPTTSNGMEEKTPHPTQKPEELVRRVLLASSQPDDLVLDPFAGSGTTLVCAQQLGRRWLGCDENEDYCSWAAARLELVTTRPVEEWIDLDRQAAERRESIR